MHALLPVAGHQALVELTRVEATSSELYSLQTHLSLQVSATRTLSLYNSMNGS